MSLEPNIIEQEPTVKCSAQPTHYHFIDVINSQTFSNDTIRIHVIGKLKLPDHNVNVLDLYMQSSNIKDFYDQLNGCFAIVISDTKMKCVYLLNDHLGVQPSFYRLHNNTLYICTSLAGLRQYFDDKLEIAKQSIFNYLFFHCIPAPDTIYHNVYKLEPGELITFNADNTVAKAIIYSPVFVKTTDDITQKQQQCLSLIDEIVSEVATSGTGAFLSGGLDSSTVVGMLAKHQRNCKTFSIGFEHPDFDETEYAKLTASHFNTSHHVHILKADEAVQDFVKVAQYFDEPFGNSSAMATYFCAKFAKNNGIDSVLAGDGGDELFSGNSRYARQKKFDIFTQQPKPIQSLLSGVFDNAVAAKIPGVSKVSSYIHKAKIPMPDRLTSFNFVMRFGADFMFEDDFIADVDQQYPIRMQQQRYAQCESDDIVDSMLFLDWKFTLADNDLVKVNQMCDLAGVSVAFPLLDKRLVEFSCQVAAQDKMPGYALRKFYKDTCKNFLPDQTLTKSKHGFGLPFGVWLKENSALHELSMQALIRFKKRKILTEELIDVALKAHNDLHSSYYGELIWIIVILELWLQKNELPIV